MKVLVIGDTHIADPYIDELRVVFDEIMSYEADHVIHLGDYYDSHKPSPRSLEFGTEMAKKLVEKYGDVSIMAGNGRHNWLNGASVIDYLRYVGVKIEGMEVIREYDGKKCLFGHHMAYASKLEYGSAHYTLKQLKKYDIVLLGHQHIPQDEKHFHHVGSSIFQHFNEVADPEKRLAFIEDGELKFVPLKTPIPMVDVRDVKELENIDAKTKVRLLISDFGEFKRIVGTLSDWKQKFVDFKYELRYEKPTDPAKKKDEKTVTKANSKVSISDEIEKVEDSEVRELLRQVFQEAKK